MIFLILGLSKKILKKGCIFTSVKNTNTMTIDIKIERCKILMSIILKSKKISDSPCERYYRVLRMYQELKDISFNQIVNNTVYTANELSTNKCYFDSPELRITSTTYERSKKRLENQINNKFKNR